MSSAHPEPAGRLATIAPPSDAATGSAARAGRVVGVARRPPVLRLRPHVPDPADRLPDRRRRSRTPRATSPSPTSATCSIPPSSRRTGSASRSARRRRSAARSSASSWPTRRSRAGCPRWVRPTLMTFSGVASNFAGVPLAFAFLATLGRTGLVTALLVNLFDFNIYRTGFNLLSFWGLALTYMYFQIPLMVLIMAPAIDGLQAGVARGGAEPRRQRLGVLAVHRAARPVAAAARDDTAPVRQRLRRRRDRLRAHRQLAQHRHHPPVRADPRRRAAQPEPRLRAGAGDDSHHRAVERRVHLAARTQRAVAADDAAVASGRGWSMLLGALYFFVPLLGDVRVLAPLPSRRVQLRGVPDRARPIRGSTRRSSTRPCWRSPRSSWASSWWCRPPTGSSCACRGCGRSWSSSRCCRW